MAAAIAGKFIPAVKGLVNRVAPKLIPGIKSQAAKNVAAGTPSVAQAAQAAAPFTAVNAGVMALSNPLLGATTGAIDLGASAFLGPKLQRAMLASNNRVLQAAAPMASSALQFGISYATPALLEGAMGGGKQQQQQVPTTNQNTAQAIADPQNEVTATRQIVRGKYAPPTSHLGGMFGGQYQ